MIRRLFCWFGFHYWRPTGNHTRQCRDCDRHQTGYWDETYVWKDDVC